VPVGLAGRGRGRAREGAHLDQPGPRSRRLVEELTWLTTIVVLLAFIGIVVWNQRDALSNPETSKKEEQ
jgi:hypothetical protein